MISYCAKCWQENPTDSRVCRNCGARLAGDNANYVGKLIQALSHPEPSTVQRAAWILGELRSSEAVEPLVRLLQTSAEAGALESAAEALGKIRDERAVESLSHLVSSSFLRVRLAAVRSLENIGGQRSLVALKGALNDPNSSVVTSARAAIIRLQSNRGDKEVSLSS